MSRFQGKPEVNMDDCRMVCRPQGAVCYIMDTCCRDMTGERRAQIEKSILHLYRQTAMKEAGKSGTV